MSTDIAFSPTVKAIQEARGSRSGYAGADWPSEITPDLAAFIGRQNSFYLATTSAAGQPYIQHRGGPAGFLRVLDSRTLGFADYRGNRQYITLGNLAENPKAFIFLMDYAHRARVKIWGRARVIEDDPDLVARLMPEGYRAKAEQAILFDVELWNGNCPQHIPMKLDAADVTAALEERDRRIAALEAELAGLRGAGMA